MIMELCNLNLFDNKYDTLLYSKNPGIGGVGGEW